ncbi:arginase [Halorussus gelatinilyticus]|uniref:Arginase n=1 Tax=Halorussus gelatinilyticus TaxID=2937524 RepID=A0A8U0IG67_9EURY|nr:arginase [Halorussus gelatinilyticus]UPV99665.1 arginase [Halorussus gelatinilyticus]
MNEQVRIIGVPMDLGADRRGVDMGSSTIRYAGLADELDALGIDVTDAGDLPVPRAEERDPEAEQPAEGEAKFLRETADVCTRLADEVADTIDAGQFPLVLGGDHSIAIGTAKGAARDADLGVVWFDAHGDFNTPKTSPSGNVHGMPLAALLGIGDFADTEWANAPNIREENVVLVGLRSLDDDERRAIRESDVTAYTMSDIDERGVTPVVEDALDVATDGTDGIHVSLDMDWLDPKVAPGVGTPVRGGVNYREAHLALEKVAERDENEGVLRSLEVVEVNAILDEHNETAELATELAASGLGKRIL